ncbi:carboxypeptidase-like regulatory domain-containing protein [Tenacibaculum aiptasiae]|uniref:Carboxypeptidase-like regulatory domain-containing protein n=1 Tax=Tenacibaculum aiptasiae TaxID=426481 RepID=A0A7J5A6L8_9FLAO|nr:carboxypeptidase-like regulatory domain-containing protein [Tenacibaculum aiptasiae]KAB1153204.1 carboxypeptidase-like regulatory domain-containing protein [Tenacibaculum aiptasiae]
MKRLLLLFFTILSFNATAQNNPKIISGYIFVDSIPTQDIHLINKKLSIGTITDEKGHFEILANKGDILIASHLNIEYTEYSISDQDLEATKITIYIDSKNHLLDEVVLEKKKGIFDIDKDILTNNAPIVNAKTLKLPYANSKKPEKDKTLKIKSGVSVSLSGLINSINGNNRKEKILRKVKSEDENISKIRKHFTDGFFVQQLKIKKENINSFLEYCISRGIINLYKKDKLLELTSILIDNSKNSPYLLEKEQTKLTQK